VTFAEPLRWLWLLAAVPLLWWLSLPSRPRTATLTPHLAQWQAALAALRRRPPRQSRLRFVLLALAAVGAAGAFAQPFLQGAPGAERLVVLLDGSASMGARAGNAAMFSRDLHTGEASSRASAIGQDASSWERAHAALRQGLANVPAHVDVTLLRVGGPMLRRHGAAARELLDLGQPEGALVADLPTLAKELAGVPGTAVWTLTDGQGQKALPDVGARTILRAAAPNFAMLAVRCEDRWPLPELELDIEYGVWAKGAHQRFARLVVEGAVVAPYESSLDMLPGAQKHSSWQPLRVARAAAGGPLVVRIAPHLAVRGSTAEGFGGGDALASDDVWRAQLPPLPAPQIAVLADAEAGPYANVAAEALAAEVGGRVVAAGGDAPVGVLLVDGGQAAIAPGAVRAITFGTRLGGGGEPLPWLAPVVADWDRTGPLTAGLDLSELKVARAWRDVLPPGEPFLWADDAGVRTPLAVVAGGDGTASVHFAFRLQDANLPLLAAFPQLLRRAFVRSYGAGAAIKVLTPPPPSTEVDLEDAAPGDDVPLSAFATPPVDLAGWFLAAALLALALRAFVR
jgi:hypothetical protein